jgi:hypothetical protein
MQSLAATRWALLAAGWSERAVPLTGDEAAGFEASGGQAVGAGKAGYGYIFRFGRHLIAAFVAGSPASTWFDQALVYAVGMSNRLVNALARQPVRTRNPRHPARR